MSNEYIPECCGSGCAVCVLDNIEPVSSLKALEVRDDPEAQCCGTGCTVCVLDYIGEDRSPEASQDRLERMLEAIDKADQIIASNTRD